MNYTKNAIIIRIYIGTFAALFLLVSKVHASPIVTGNLISWPDNGWYQVQTINSGGIMEICQGGRFCEVFPGEFIVINHTTGERFTDIFVTDAAETTQVTVNGNVINWPDDGWYQVQDEQMYSEICSGTRSCTVEAGSYVVINHSTGQRYPGIQVGDRSEIESNIVVFGNTITWPDDGWYQVQDAATFESVCEGVSFCTVQSGVYNVINHSTGIRVEVVVLNDNRFNAQEMFGETWLLTSVKDNVDVLTPVTQQLDFKFTVRFSEDSSSRDGYIGSVDGRNNCNGYNGMFALESNVLLMSHVTEDTSVCERMGDYAASLFNRLLTSEYSMPPVLSLNMDRLTMTFGNNEALIFSVESTE